MTLTMNQVLCGATMLLLMVLATRVRCEQYDAGPINMRTEEVMMDLARRFGTLSHRLANTQATIKDSSPGDIKISELYGGKSSANLLRNRRSLMMSSGNSGNNRQVEPWIVTDAEEQRILRVLLLLDRILTNPLE